MLIYDQYDFTVKIKTIAANNQNIRTDFDRNCEVIIKNKFN